MGLYSTLLGEERVQEMLEGKTKILLVSCPGCACESLSYAEDLPNRRIEQLADMDANAVAVNLVRDRWAQRLRDAGKQVRFVSIVFPCEMFDTEREKLLRALGDCDAVALLACSSAYIGVRDMLAHTNLPLVPMMKTSGSFVFRLIQDESGEYSKVERESAVIHSFSSHGQEV